MLQTHINAEDGQKTCKFGKLLLLLGKIRMPINDIVELGFFKEIIGAAKIEKLLCDMFQN